MPRKRISMTGGLFALFDDIASMLDSSATMTKIAAKNTAGVLGDDLAINAEKASKFHASREIPVLMKITKGSFVNKLIILPIAFLLSAFAPWVIVPILMMGALYLSFEGAEKIIEWIVGEHKTEESGANTLQTPEEIMDDEKTKITSAVRTDFILSIEIVVIALGTVTGKPLPQQIIAVSIAAILATIGVYGVVTLLVRLDDIGMGIMHRSTEGGLSYNFGKLLIASLPKIVRLLSVVGTIAMLLVAGGIFIHNIDILHHIFAPWPFFSGELTLGLAIGLAVVGLVHIAQMMTGNPSTGSGV
jgi:predicted DNA repair protein MutK